MKASRISVLATLIAIVLCGAAAAQELNITGAGARAEGMAGAFIGVADDATALVWNPAGIATLERPEASTVVRYVSNSFELKAFDWKQTDSHGVLNFVSGAYPVALGGKHLVLAAAYQRQIDLYSEQRGSSATGGVNTFTPGFGLRLTPSLSVGGAANIWFGSEDLNTEAAYSGSGDDEVENHDFSGVNANVGVLFDMEGFSKPIPLRIGACLRTPFTLKDEGSAIFSAGGFQTDELTFTRKYDMPVMLGVGASYRVGENLTVAADFETRKFGGSKVSIAGEDMSGNQFSYEGDMSANGDDLNEFRVGAEYLIMASLGVIPVRVGFRTAPTLLADIDDSGAVAGQVVGTAVSLGTGIILSRMSFDAAVTVASYEEKLGTVGKLEITQTTGTVSGIFYF